MKLIWLFSKRMFHVVGILLVILLAIVVLATKATGGEPNLFGYQIMSVLSGSMEPEFSTGSIITVALTKKDDVYKTGDVITFQNKENMLITHRIIDLTETNDQTVYTTKGDSNAGKDLEPVFHENIIGKYSGMSIPYVGYLLQFANSKEGSAILLFIPGLMLFFHSIITIRDALHMFKKQYRPVEK